MLKTVVIIFCFALVISLSYGCKERHAIESIEISPVTENSNDKTASGKYVCDPDGEAYRQFEVTGLYSDDDNEDLTDEVTWSTDSSDDSVLSTVIPGMVYCNNDYGVFGVMATYELESGESSSSDEEEDSDSELTDTVLIDTQQ